jgi:sugar phosphate isomerase/epimerase
MNPTVPRRSFLQATGALAAGIGLAGLAGGRLSAVAAAEGASSEKGAPHAEKLGWRLGCQAYSFNRFTFDEAVEKTASLGLHYIEAYPGQKINKESSLIFGESLDAGARSEIKKTLSAANVRLVNYGVTGLSKNETASHKTFEFAKDMGIETIVSEPPADAFDLLDKLCEEYGINVALHNHPRPSTYWNPDHVLEVCKGHSKRIGSCCDTGHWMRSGINPIEALKKLEGRIISFHFKDLNENGPQAHDVPWGTGKGDVKGMLTEIHRQGVKAAFSIEYEYHWENSLPELAQCVKYFDQVAATLGG